MGASDDGLIYVFDAGNYRIQVYDAEGRYHQTIGRRGGGPGEISQPSGHFVVAGDQLVLGGGYGNLAIWDRRTGVGTFRGQAASGARILWRLGSTEAGADEKRKHRRYDSKKHPQTQFRRGDRANTLTVDVFDRALFQPGLGRDLLWQQPPNHNRGHYGKKRQRDTHE